MNFKIGDLVTVKPGLEVVKWKFTLEKNKIYIIKEVMSPLTGVGVVWMEKTEGLLPNNGIDSHRIKKIDPNSLTKLQRILYDIEESE